MAERGPILIPPKIRTVPALDKSPGIGYGLDMHDFYPVLRDLIQERLDVVADRDHYARDANGHLERLVSVSEKLVRAVDSLPPDTNAHLRHYLDQQSYLKALSWLDQAIEGQSPAETGVRS